MLCYVYFTIQDTKKIRFDEKEEIRKQDELLKLSLKDKVNKDRILKIEL